jgi:hypothetical protein
MMNRIYCGRFWLIGIAALACLGVQPCLGQDSEANPAPKGQKKAGERDPVEAAFAVPFGTVLNEKQRTEYERLKESKEAALREAYDALAAATTWKDKSEIRGKISGLEREVRAAMRKILKMSDADSSQAPQQQQPAVPQGSAVPQGYGSYGQAAYYGAYYSLSQGGYGLGYYSPGYGFAGDAGWYGDYYGPWNRRYGYGYPYVGYPSGSGTTRGSSSGSPSNNSTAGTPSKPAAPSQTPTAPARSPSRATGGRR